MLNSSEKCTVDEYKMIREYLATIPSSEIYSALVVDLKAAFVGSETIEDTQLDAILQSGKFSLDQYDQCIMPIPNSPNLDR
jgi:hypothetical protein